MALLALPLLAGCKAQPPQGQVAARVNGAELTVHQINFSIGAEAAHDAGRRQAALDKLIDRELALQQALAMGLERRPELMLRLEEIRRDVLAEAWRREAAAEAAPPDENEMAKYYRQNPGLFAERKRYRLRVLMLPEADANSDESLRRAAAGATTQQIMAWLQQQGAPPPRVIEQYAEQLPIAAVESLRRLDVGEGLTFRSSRGVILYEVLAVAAAPLSWEQSQAMIGAWLGQKLRNERVEEKLLGLRKLARIELAADVDERKHQD